MTRSMLVVMVMAMVIAAATPAQAESINVSKSASVISDPLGNPIPRSIPGAVVDYTITLSNPGSNAGKPVRNLVFEDQLPANVALRVADLDGAGNGPVMFANGAIVLGIGDSGLTYNYGGLGNASDALEFSDGTNWSYVPVADAAGYDANVRAIRVRPETVFKTGGSFTLRFRVRVR